MRPRQLVGRAALSLQARSGRVPPAVRAAGKRLVTGLALFDRSVPELEGWDEPLAAGQRPEVLSARGRDTSVTAPSSPRGSLPWPFPGVEGEGRRCLVLTDVLDVGGLDEFAALLARRLPMAGWSVSVAKTGAPGGHLTAVLSREGVAVHEAATPEALRGVLDEEQPDVVSAHAPRDWAFDLLRRAGVPVVETLHGAPTPLTTDWTSEPARSRSVTAFVGVSDLVRRHYCRGNPAYPAGAVVAIPNGYDGDQRPPTDRLQARRWLGLDDQYLLVSLGRLSAEKNTYGLVAAFAEVALKRDDCHLLVAGRVDDPVYARQVLQLRSAQPEQIRRRIHVRENTTSVAEVLAASDCYVMDSFYEGWGLGSMEALGAGIPIIRSDTGGAVEQVGPNCERGYLVPNPAGDPESVTWTVISDSRFVRQANHDALVAAMRAAMSDRAMWQARRAAIAAEAPTLFPLAECASRHSVVLRHAAEYPTAERFATVPLAFPSRSRAAVDAGHATR